MGAVENFADLRCLLSIVAEETGAFKMEDADEDSVGWTTEGPLPMTFGHVRRAHAALAALEAAISAAEPAGFVYGPDLRYGSAVMTKLKGDVVESHDNSFVNTDTPLYTAPPAPSVAVKAFEWSDEDNGDFIAQSIVGWYHIGLPHLTWNLMTPNGDVPSFNTLKEAKAAAQADYEARVSSALSAQVQGVAGHEPFGAPGPDAMRVIDSDQWEPCSPDYLRRGGCCATAPRVWNAGHLNHYHPKLPAAPAKQEGKP